MNYFVGIDLGSTTTKAVVLDQKSRALGYGITNSRSNYEVACQVALTEALINARFSIISNELDRSLKDGHRKEDLLRRLELHFRERRYCAQLESLASVLGDIYRQTRVGKKIIRVTEGILEEMRREAPDLFRVGANRKSDFFRDLAGSRYVSLAEDAAKKSRTNFDFLVGLFDKSILLVENTPRDPGQFGDHIKSSLERLGGAAKELGPAVEKAIRSELVQVGSVGTGYGRQRLPFPKEDIRSEILCHGLGAHAMFPGTRTVLDIGGQDTKAIQVDASGIVTSFQMNDRCAAGCGRYLGYIADEMNLGLHELGPLAVKSTTAVKINSTCTVFAGAELRERLSLGEQREDILAGLHRAVILRALSLLARSGGVSDEFTFTGGVAKNPAAVTALQRLVRENYGDVTINISPESIYTGALGAALFAVRGARKAVA